MKKVVNRVYVNDTAAYQDTCKSYRRLYLIDHQMLHWLPSDRMELEDSQSALTNHLNRIS